MVKALLRGELIVAIDFDGTITTNPDLGGDLELRPNCKEVLQCMHEDGVKLILWTCRTGFHLVEALRFLEEHDLLGCFDAYNTQLPEITDKYSPNVARKVGADLYVDDKGFGIKLDTLWTDLKEHIYGEV